MNKRLQTQLAEKPPWREHAALTRQFWYT